MSVPITAVHQVFNPSEKNIIYLGLDPDDTGEAIFGNPTGEDSC